MSEGVSDSSAIDGASADCHYCDREFTRAEYRDLHLGLDHADVLSPAERSAYETARETEEAALTLFRYKALGLLVLVYFGFLILYAVSL